MLVLKQLNRFLISFLIILSTLVVLIFAGSKSILFAEPTDNVDLTELSIEELMNIEITSPSKKLEKLFDTPAAVYVITSEDIRRSGAKNLPDVLRIVPGVVVAQINSSEWAISIRGFNSRFANKLLVLIDGRSVYTPLFAGVFWEEIDSIFEDIDRIEIIRGPGGNIWGANAVNGVINIITKDSKDTQGFFVTSGGGNEEQGFVEIRYGAKISDNFTYRIFGKFFNRDEFEDPRGEKSNDSWHSFRTGFRSDLTISTNDTMSLSAEFYNIDKDQTVEIPILTDPPDFAEEIKDKAKYKGFNFLHKWRHIFSNNSESQIQTYYDYTERTFDFFGKEKRHTLDIDFTHNLNIHFALPQEIIWGLGFRLTSDNFSDNTSILIINDLNRTDKIFSAFFQDSLSLIKDKLFLTIGSKFEHNDYSGFELQPDLRILWIPHEEHRIWASVSRAVRTPSRAEHDISINLDNFTDPESGILTRIFAVGTDNFDSEELVSLEAGYRTQPVSWFSADIAFFLNFYDNLSTIELQEPVFETQPFPNIIIPALFDNNMDATLWGFEISTTITPTNYWKLIANYSYINIDADLNSPSIVFTESFIEDGSPENQIKLQSFLDLPQNLELDASLYYVDKLNEFNISDYFRFDLRLGWKPNDNLEFSIVGQNLFDGEHQEFGSSQTGLATVIERSIFGSITYRN